MSSLLQTHLEKRGNVVLEIVQALHEAFHTDSRWLFVLYIALTFALLAAALAYVVDSGYQRRLKEQRQSHQSVPTFIRDTAEEERLRVEVNRLKKELNDRNTLKRNIQAKLADFMNQGNLLRDDWQKSMGSTVEVQRAHAKSIEDWHLNVESYLRTIPRGKIYVTKFHNQIRGMGSYPVGINVEVGGAWDTLMSDLRRLSEFIGDPELGNP